MVKNQNREQRLSVVLATFNEEKNLPALLKSIKTLADEIVVVDGTSTDRTVEIAKKYGAKVIVTKNLSNFHINKQKAIDLATKDWIFQLDADERVSDELTNEIKGKLGNDQDINGYWLPRKNWFLGRFLMKGGQYPDYTLRLYRKGKGHLPQVHVHEQAEVDGKVGYLEQALLHYPYNNFASYISKWNRYNFLLASQIKGIMRNKNIFARFIYAIGYLIIKPAHWFLTTYIRHKGFMDLWPGFVFSFFSALRFPVSYFKYIINR
jgi:glycosyltransferase involved in cell wall biosynthesis